jgi:hypothetical protein
MPDDVEYPKRGYDTKDVEAMKAENPPGGRRPWGKIALFSVVIVPVLLFALWAWITLNWAYSEGDRAGYLQKFSKKGWLCKTWEGELQLVAVPGSVPQSFLFSVRDDSIAAELNKHMGKRVSVTYQEHKGVPTSCFGETQYHVVGVRAVDDPAYPGGPPPAPGGTQLPPPPPPAAPPPG